MICIKMWFNFNLYLYTISSPWYNLKSTLNYTLKYKFSGCNGELLLANIEFGDKKRLIGPIIKVKQLYMKKDLSKWMKFYIYEGINTYTYNDELLYNYNTIIIFWYWIFCDILTVIVSPRCSKQYVAIRSLCVRGR